MLSSNSFIDPGIASADCIRRLMVVCLEWISTLLWNRCLLVGTYGHFWPVSFQPIMWRAIWAFFLSSFSLCTIKLSHNRALYPLVIVCNTCIGGLDSFEFGNILWFWTSAVGRSTIWLWICIHKCKKLLQCLAFGRVGCFSNIPMTVMWITYMEGGIDLHQHLRLQSTAPKAVGIVNLLL